MFRSRSLPAPSVLVLVAAGLLAGCGTEKVATRQVPVAAPAPDIRDGSLMTPGRPQITPLPGNLAPGEHEMTWNMWWGENGSQWTVYLNGDKVSAGALKAATPNGQEGTLALPLDLPGDYEIKVSLCNDHGCTESDPALVTVSAG